MSEFKKIQKNIETVLHNPTYVELFKSKGILISDVKIAVVPIIPNVLIIQKLIKNVKLNKYEKDELKNTIWNVFFDDNIYNNIQFNNKIHIGMLIQILSTVQFDVLSPFYPLQQFPTQYKLVSDITLKLSKMIINNLQKTKIKTFRTKTYKLNKKQ